MPRLYALLALLHAYVAWRIAPDLVGTPALFPFILWLVASVILMPHTFGARDAADRVRADRLAWAGGIAMGAFSSLLVLTVLRDIALVVATQLLAAGAIAELRRRSAIVVPLLAIALTLLGLFNARRRAAIRNVDVPIDGLPDALDGFTIVQISDVHIGPTIKRRYVEAIVDAANALRADMIAITGDLVDGSVTNLREQASPLSRLVSRHGTFFVTGNHEYYSGARSWVAELRRLGMRVLMNEHVVLAIGDAKLVVAGVTDYSAQHFEGGERSDPARALAGAPATPAVKLLLAHQPRSAFAARDAGFDLQLSGHTHGGQFLPWNFLVRLQQPFTAGLRKLGALTVYTSRGTGYWGPPMRLGAPSEITRLTLVPA